MENWLHPEIYNQFTALRLVSESYRIKYVLVCVWVDDLSVLQKDFAILSAFLLLTIGSLCNKFNVIRMANVF